MRLFSYVFGKESRDRRNGVGARIVAGAHGALNSKIIRNPVNKWWVVLLREYIFWPVIRLPFSPLAEANQVIALYKTMVYVLDVLAVNGTSVYRSYAAALAGVIKKKSDPVKKVHLLLSIVFWKPNIKSLYPGKSARNIYGHYIWWEKQLTLKLIALTYIFWIGSFVMLFQMFASLFSEGFSSVGRDVAFLVTSKDIFKFFDVYQSMVTTSVLLSVSFWVISFFISFLVAERPWNKHTRQVRRFLEDFGYMSQSDYARMLVFSIDDLVYVSYPNMNVDKIRKLRSGWPRNFLLGEIIENVKNQDDLIVFRRPEKEPILFGGDRANSEISEHISLFDTGIIEPMKRAIRHKGDSELFFAGEVIDNKWWAGNQIFLQLATSPHCVIAGQTRSGKTKTVLSVVYSFARAYPDTVWYFADGKGSPDYDTFAAYLSEFSVAKPDTAHGDNLIQLANIIEALWTEFLHRRYLFDKAMKIDGKSCSTIYQYRELVGPMPQVFFVCDEFSFFVTEMDYENNWRNENTLAYKLKNLVNQAANMGFHFILASQRYTVTDMPATIRSGMTTKMIHHVQLKDADHVEIPEAVHLDKGQFYVTAHGLFCHHTGISKVKSKMPFIGEKPDVLLAKTLTPMDPALKKQFDYHLIYSRGDDDVAQMSVSQFCIRLHKFFKDQGYITKNILADLEAGDLQMEAIKAKRFKKSEPGMPPMIQLEAITDAPSIGISVMRYDELDESALQGIQDKYVRYQAILVFITGRNVSSDKLKFVSRLNERGSRFVVLPSRDYLKDLRFVEMKRKEGTYIDLIKEKLHRIGVNVSSMTASTTSPAGTMQTFSKDVPVKTLIERFSTLLKMPIVPPGDAAIPGLTIPYVKVIAPGGTPVFFLITKEKSDKVEALNIVEVIKKQHGVAVIVSPIVAETDKKATAKTEGLAYWSPGSVFSFIQRIDSAKGNDKTSESRAVMTELMQELSLVKAVDDVSAVGLSFLIVLHPNTKVEIRSLISSTPARIDDINMTCGLTGYSLFSFTTMELRLYRRDFLKIPETASIILKNGIAPLGTLPSNLIDERGPDKPRPDSLGKEWTIENGILCRAKSDISEDDPLLMAMREHSVP